MRLVNVGEKSNKIALDYFADCLKGDILTF